MFPPFWGLPAAGGSLSQLQEELDRMKQRFDAVFTAMLTGDPATVAQTPADVVYSEGKLRLLHYCPQVERPLPIPLLIIPSLITRYYLLDLLPGKSLVEYLVRQGLDVYLVDWGTPGPEDRLTTLDQYLSGHLRRVVQRVRVRSGQDQISLLGYSMGGTLAAIWTAIYGRQVRNLVQIAAPINFHDEGLLSQWTRKDRFNVDLVVDTLATMPLALMQASFRMLKPTALIAQQIAVAEQFGRLEVVQDFLAMQTWLDDTIPFLGEAYRKYVKECYQENALLHGKLMIGRQRVDLTRIECALLTITAVQDQICPPGSARILNDLVSSTDKQLLELPGSHTGIISGRRAAGQLWPKLAEWLRQRSVNPAAESAPAIPEAVPAAEPAANEELAVAALPVEPAANEQPPVEPATDPATNGELSSAVPAADPATNGVLSAMVSAAEPANGVLELQPVPEIPVEKPAKPARRMHRKKPAG